MRWKSHVRFGRRAAETDRSRDRHRAAARPHTEHPTAEGKVHCCAIKDLFSNRIVGYALDERMTAQLAVTALRTAVARRRPAGVVVVHSDRGVPCPDLPRGPGRRRTAGLDGTSRRPRGQRRDGVVLGAAAEERAQPAALADPRRAPQRSRVLGRTHPTPGAAGSAHSASSPRSSTSLPSPVRLPSQHEQSQPPSTEASAVPF
jgi:hypothetical protein